MKTGTGKMILARELTREAYQGCEYALTNPDDPADWVGMSEAVLADSLPPSERPLDAEVGDDVVVYSWEGEPAILDPSMLVWVREAGE